MTKMSSSLAELVADYWGAYRQLFLCEMTSILNLKRRPQPPYECIGGFRGCRILAFLSPRPFYLSSISLFQLVLLRGRNVVEPESLRCELCEVGHGSRLLSTYTSADTIRWGKLGLTGRFMMTASIGLPFILDWSLP